MADDERAARYHRRQLLLAGAGVALTLAYLFIVLVTGMSRDLAQAAVRLTSAWWAQLAIATVVLAAAYELLAFPLAWIRGYVLPRRYGLLHQSALSWLGDQLKAAALGGIVGLAGVEVIYGLLRVSPWWWLIAAAVFFVGYVLMIFVVPIWVLPLFYRLTPLEPGPLRERLIGLADRAGVPVVGVWIADQSRKSRTVNAAVVGLGRTRRILLFDTLLADFPPEEIQSVLAHELGHHVHGDIRRGLLLQGMLTLVSFELAALSLDAGVALFG